MSKITLTQEFDSYEEHGAFKIASQASDMKIALDEIIELLRKYDKYGHEFKDPDEAIEKIRSEVWEIIQSNNISME
jgi:hypothetical protein